MNQYHELLNHVLSNGVESDDRTGVGTLSIFGYQNRYDLSKGFPLLTTRKINMDMVTSELIWMLEGSSDERRLAEIRYGKPRVDLTAKKTIWTANADNQGKRLGYTNTDLEKRLGPVYGVQFRNASGVDQIANLINQIKTNPDSRRLIVSSWNVAEIEQMALPPCHALFQFYVRNNKISCQLYQRSADVILGVPANVAFYSLLTHMVAQVCDLDVGEFVHTFGDAHVYLNHLEGAKEQLSRESYALPTLGISKKSSIDDYRMGDVWINDYEHHPHIKFPMAV